MSEGQQIPTLEAVRAACDTCRQHIASALERLSDPISDEPDAGGWSTRQLLSHLIGAFYRVPIQASFALAGAGNNGVPTIPIEMHDAYWLQEWETASVQTFRTALEVTYHGNLAFLDTLSPADLAVEANTRFGEMNLGGFLMLGYVGHPVRFHGQQLESFLGAH
jgi:hypothetical protein